MNSLTFHISIILDIITVERFSWVCFLWLLPSEFVYCTHLWSSLKLQCGATCGSRWNLLLQPRWPLCRLAQRLIDLELLMLFYHIVWISKHLALTAYISSSCFCSHLCFDNISYLSNVAKHLWDKCSKDYYEYWLSCLL